MANRYAVASGDWSNPAIWDGGTLPASADVVRPNGFNVTIDISVTALELRNNAAAPAVAGGKFFIGNGVTVAANLIGHSLNTFEFSLNSPNSCNVVGDLVAGQSNAFNCFLVSGGGTVNITGNLIPNTNSPALNITGTGANVNITGNISGGTTSGAQACNVSSSSTLTVNGTVSGGTQAVTAGIASSIACNIVVNGIVSGGGGNFGINATGASNITVNGTVISSNGFAGLYSVSASGLVVLNGNAENVGGRMAIWSPVVFIAPSVNQWKFTQTDLTTDRTLYSAETLPGSPAEEDVREGVTYGPASELEGTLIVPDPSNVRNGVPTDATTGTAQLTAEDILEAIELSANPVAERLRNVSTVQTTGDQIAALNPLP
jgi:hypothetical protein